MRANRKLCFILAVLVPMCFICFHVWSKSDKVVAVWNREAPEDVLDISLLQPSDKYAHISLKWKDDILERLPRNNCKCEAEATLNIPFRQQLFGKPYAVNFGEAVAPSLADETYRRRELEYNNFKMRSHSLTDRIIIAEANSPLQYPVQGVKVHPLKTVLIPGLSLLDLNRKSTYEHCTVEVEGQSNIANWPVFHRSGWNFAIPAGGRYFEFLNPVRLSCTIGTFDVAAEVDSVTIKGAGEKEITLSSPLLDNLNRQLQLISYTNTVFYPNTADTVKFQTDGHSATFTIKVRHPVVPKLYDMGSSNSKYNISALVTIATKTFLRYDKLQNLIDSIRKFYPTVTIIIADDSQTPQKVEGSFIEQYIMPFGKGWFAGRNLAISQVATKYVLWVDDDFIFCSRTNIEKLVDVLEKTTLDLVGGAVREITGYATTYRQKISVLPGDKEGDCLMTRQGYHHVIEGFPNCVVADGVVNFFLARTEKVLKVGFDPRLSRVAHLEFFIDGLGTLHVGSCDDVIVDHASKIHLPWSKTQTDKEYSKFRYPKSSNSRNTAEELFYFKNHFKCMTGN